jgi:hypothetical protein
MLEQLKIKPVEVSRPKAEAPVRAASSRSSEKTKDLQSSLESDEFKNELESAKKVSEPEVKEKSPKASEKKEVSKTDKKEEKEDEAKVKIQGEMLPLETVGPTATAFDPAMMKEVEEAIVPESVSVEGLVAPAPKLTAEQVRALASGDEAATEVEAAIDAELAQALLKTPNVNEAQATGRAPAIEFAQSEVDPKLMSMEDFVAQKNLAAKKNMPVSGYGMNKPQVQKLALENGLKSTQVVKDIGALENPNAQSGPVNSQQFILNMMKESGNTNASDVHGAAAVKVFDMSNIKSSNPTEIMNQITDYIVQAKAASEPTVNMRINHQELGLIDITVQKSMGGLTPDSVAINIGTHSLDGKTFFQQNSKDLFSHLSQSGVNVSDMKIETPSQTAKNDFDMNQGSEQRGQSSQKQFGSEQNQRRHDSDRRQDLWKLFNKEAA